MIFEYWNYASPRGINQQEASLLYKVPKGKTKSWRKGPLG
jgi:hypothetical protein